MDDSEDETATMSAAMGFSSFGGPKPPNKRRKFNSATDAIVASSSVPSSGANATPRGIRSRKNRDEVVLDFDDEEAGEPHASTSAKIKFNKKEAGDDDDNEDPKPHYSEISCPAAPSNNDVGISVQAKIDAIIEDSAIQGLAAQPASSNANDDLLPPLGHGGHQAGRRQGRGPGQEWWQDYYDPSANINPWEQLETKLGLEASGSWMSWDEAKTAKG